jgi:DNA-binding transcriptional LysR family regulator
MRVAIFALGFLTGQEMDRLPEAMRVLRDVLPEIEVTISSQYSPLLADALTKGKLDLAFMRAEPGMPDLTYQLVAEESLVAVLPSDHRLAAPSDGDRSRAAVTGWKQPVLVGEVGRVSGEERQDIGLQQRVRPGPQRGLTNGLGGPLAVLSSRRSSDPPRRPKIQETFHGQDCGATPPASLSARRRQLQAPGPVLIAVDIARLDFAPA